MRCYVFFGIQGSGKGTQAELLSEALDYQHINIGDLFRNQVAQNTELGQTVKAIVERGELVPDELVFQIVDNSLKPDCKGIVFDGFPRTVRQAEFLVKHFQVMKVFFLELEEAEAIGRISSRRVCPDCGANYNLHTNSPAAEGVCDKCGGKLAIRKDDSPEAISKRLKEFYEQTLVLREFFREKGLLCAVNASLGIEDVARQIRNEIGSA